MSGAKTPDKGHKVGQGSDVQIPSGGNLKRASLKAAGIPPGGEGYASGRDSRAASMVVTVPNTRRHPRAPCVKCAPPSRMGVCGNTRCPV